MKKSDNIEKQYICTTVYLIIAILKWAYFMLAIITAGFTVGLLVMSLFYGSSLSNDIVSQMFSYITFTSSRDALEIIKLHGLATTVVAATGYGIALTITYGLTYNVFNKFTNILISIITGNMYTKENAETLNKLFPLTFILAFTQPVFIFIISSIMGIFGPNYINVSGLIYVFVVFILKLIFEKGYELERKNEKSSTELSDFKAREAELKMEALKQEAEIKELKKQLKNTEEAPVAKTVAKKAPAKKAAAPKKTTTAKKTTTKKTTTKKTTK